MGESESDRGRDEKEIERVFPDNDNKFIVPVTNN